MKKTEEVSSAVKVLSVEERNKKVTGEFLVKLKVKTILYAKDDNCLFTGAYVGDKAISKNFPDEVASELQRIVVSVKNFKPKKNEALTIKGYFHKEKRGEYDNYLLFVNEIDNGYSHEENMFYQFITSGFIDGLNATTSMALINKYGTDPSVFSDEKKLCSIRGIAKLSANKIIASYQEKKKFFDLYVLTNGFLTTGMLKKIENLWGEDSLKMVKNSPYELMYAGIGFGFKRSDLVAFSMGLTDISTVRLEAAIVNGLNEAADNLGHTFMFKEDLKTYAAELLFSKDYLKDIYYKEILELTNIPKDISNWTELKISGYTKKNVEKIISEWNVYDEKREAYCKERIIALHKLTDVEASLIDILIAKRQVLYDQFEDILISLEKANKIVILEDKIFETEYFESEVFIAKAIVKNIKDKAKGKYNIIFPEKEHIIQAIKEYELSEGRQLGDEQIEGVYKSSTNTISVITGGPGRGKTAVLKVVIRAFEIAGNRKDKIKLLAPTGRAAARMTESTDGHPAITMYRHTMKRESYKRDCIYICDESSMVNTESMEKLMRYSEGCVFIFVGDIDQLPSIGAGAILRDLINSGVIPVTRLITCYRNEGSIIENIDKINTGVQFEKFTLDNHSKYSYFNQDDGSSLENQVYKLYMDLIKKGFSKDEIGIVTCKRKMGKSSASNLNRFIQSKVNPVPDDVPKEVYELGYSGRYSVCEDGSMAKDYQIFRKNDRVIHLKNNYQMEVRLPFYVNGKVVDYTPSTGCFNGETGTIIEIDGFSETLVVRFDDGKEATYTKAELEELELAYAITTHKCQGSEYKAVIVVETKEDFIMLERNILYTAASRAKELLIFLGSAKYFNIAIKTVSGKVRNTDLVARISEFMETLTEDDIKEMYGFGKYHLITEKTAFSQY